MHSRARRKEGCTRRCCKSWSVQQHTRTHSRPATLAALLTHTGPPSPRLSCAFCQAAIPLSPDAFHTLVQSFYILSTLDTERVYSLAVQHPAAIDQLLLSIAPELTRAELAARFRLLDLILLESACHPSRPLKLTIDFEHIFRELMEVLANESASVFALAASNMVSDHEAQMGAGRCNGVLR